MKLQNPCIKVTSRSFSKHLVLKQELLEFFGYEMIEDLNTDAVYAKRLETYAEEDLKNWIQLSEDGNQVKVLGAQ